MPQVAEVNFHAPDQICRDRQIRESVLCCLNDYALQFNFCASKTLARPFQPLLIVAIEPCRPPSLISPRGSAFNTLISNPGAFPASSSSSFLSSPYLLSSAVPVRGNIMQLPRPAAITPLSSRAPHHLSNVSPHSIEGFFRGVRFSLRPLRNRF